MKTRSLTQCVGVIALTVTSMSPASYAQNEETEGCSTPKIITFDAPHGGKGPGAAFCFNGCPGTEPYNNNIRGAVTGYVSIVQSEVDPC